MEFFDSHAHITSSAVYDEVDLLLQRAQAAHVLNIVNICTDHNTLEKGLELQKRYPWVLQAAATTPHDVEKEGEQFFPIVAFHARSGDLVAVGESGLDYFYEHSPKEEQKRFLVKYFQLAIETRLPIIIHCREAFADFFEILDVEYMSEGTHLPGVLHCFTGTVAEAEEVINRGWYLSLSGIVTFKKSEELREVARMVPLDQLLIETDTPYLAPQRRRGKTNEPAFVVEIAELIAQEKNIPLSAVAEATTHNGKTLFFPN